MSLTPDTPVRITFSVPDSETGESILHNLTEERLIAGGTCIRADAVHWIGGDIRMTKRREVTAYTTLDCIPLITLRVSSFFSSGVAPAISQYIMDAPPVTKGWITRNTRQ